jgi:hypothetical protein
MKRLFYTARRGCGEVMNGAIGESEADAMANEVAGRAERAASGRNDGQAEAIFGPGMAQPGVHGLAGREGMPRQWAYGASVNVAQRPRGTEQTSFEQLRNLAALYDGIQL